MLYIDQNGVEIESFDLKKGYLIDAEWADHPEVPGLGHYEYTPLPGGGRRQTYVVDEPFIPAWREITVKQYIPYTDEELADITGKDYDAILDAHEASIQQLTEQQEGYAAAYQEGVQSA